MPINVYLDGKRLEIQPQWKANASPVYTSVKNSAIALRQIQASIKLI